MTPRASVRFASNGGGRGSKPPFTQGGGPNKNAPAGGSLAPVKKSKKIEIVLEEGQRFSVESDKVDQIRSKTLQLLGMDAAEPGVVEYYDSTIDEWLQIEELEEMDAQDLSKLSQLKVRVSPMDDYENEYDTDETHRGPPADLVVEDLAETALSKDLVKPGRPMPSEEQVRAFVIREAGSNRMVAAFITGNIGGLEHLVKCLQLPFVYGTQNADDLDK